MAIEIEINMAGLAAHMGQTEEELERELARLLGEVVDESAPTAPQAPGTTPAAPTTPNKAPAKRYRYTIGNSKSGVCPLCAPYAGMLTTGDGTDGVPVPPVHNNCVCFLTPVAFDAFGTDVKKAMARRFEWLENLTPPALEEIVGKPRADLVKAKIVTVPELYDNNGQLILLHDLMLAAKTGWQGVKQASIVTGLSSETLKDLAKRRIIKDAYRLSRGGDWLIPADWALAYAAGEIKLPTKGGH